MRLKDKTAIITGAGGDIGRGIALRLSEEGCRLMINDKNLKTAEVTMKSVMRQGGAALHHGADVTKADEVRDMIDKAITEWGRIDILVNNAGEIRDAPLTKMSDEDWNYVLKLNLMGSFICAREVAPYMIKQNSGKIVNISSMAYKGNVCQANYSASKSGLVGLTHALGLELARYKINVNCIAPGLIATEKILSFEDKVRERIIQKTPMRCMGEIIDIANAVLFFVSDESKFITRQVLHVSGGMEGF